MQPKLETLHRLMTLYAAVEEMHSTELQRVTAAVREAQRAIAREHEIAWSVRMESRRALKTGDRLQWMMAETQRETSSWRRQGLEEIRRERQELTEAAREQYVASRLKREQMKRVVDDILARTRIEESRREQAASDDRFLARRRWVDRQDKTWEGRRMKTS